MPTLEDRGGAYVSTNATLTPTLEDTRNQTINANANPRGYTAAICPHY